MQDNSVRAMEKEIVTKEEEENFEIEEEEDEFPELDIPVQQRHLLTHPYDFIIRSLKSQVDDGSLILADKFQRRQVWDLSKCSRLIESLLLNVPIPVCYFAELDDGSYSVIDGQQRLTAIYQFLTNKYALRGLKVLRELNRKSFKNLDVAYQRYIYSRTIRCIVIAKESHPDIKFDVFERLNSGFVALNAQELRNSVHRGKLNDLILELSENEIFLKTRNIKEIDKRMRDCELILRFFAFHYALKDYRGNLSRFLDQYLEKGRHFDAATIQQHRDLFMRVIGDVYEVFDNRAFRRYTFENGWENAINRAIYDVIMLSFAALKSEAIRGKKAAIAEALREVCQDAEFNESITSSTKNKDRIQMRLDKWRNKLLQIGLDVPYFQVGQ